MRRTWMTVLLPLVVAGCSGKGSKSAGGGTGTGLGTGGGTPVEAPLPPPTPRPPPSQDPVVDSAPPAEWWKLGAKACPADGRLDGGPPPETHARCLDAKSMEEGPEGFWSPDGKLLSTGLNHEGRRTGRWVSYFPDGKKHTEGTYLRGQQHGVWTEWHPDGSVFNTGRWVDGRPDGDFVWTTPDGKEVGRVTMKLGTGTWTTWNPDGSKHESYGYVDGVAHGPYTAWHPNGQVAATGRFVDGNADGLELTFDEQGRKRHQTSYKNSSYDGEQITWDEQGNVTLLERYQQSEQLASIRYKDGKPLGAWKPSKCDRKEGLTKVLGGDDSGQCVDRAYHFPGLVLIGSFAHDRGCMGRGYVLDCAVKSGAPDPKAMLARAGWSAGSAKDKEVWAEALVKEVLHRFDGSVSYEPEPLKVVVAGDGSAVVTYWLQDPSGMQRGWTRHLLELKIGSDGSVSEKELKSESGGRD